MSFTGTRASSDAARHLMDLLSVISNPDAPALLQAYINAEADASKARLSEIENLERLKTELAPRLRDAAQAEEDAAKIISDAESKAEDLIKEAKRLEAAAKAREADVSKAEAAIVAKQGEVDKAYAELSGREAEVQRLEEVAKRNLALSVTAKETADSLLKETKDKAAKVAALLGEV